MEWELRVEVLECKVSTEGGVPGLVGQRVIRFSRWGS